MTAVITTVFINKHKAKENPLSDKRCHSSSKKYFEVKLVSRYSEDASVISVKVKG